MRAYKDHIIGNRCTCSFLMMRPASHGSEMVGSYRNTMVVHAASKPTGHELSPSYYFRSCATHHWQRNGLICNCRRLCHIAHASRPKCLVIMIITKWHNDGGLNLHWLMHLRQCPKNGQHSINTMKKRMTHEDHEESFAGAVTPEHVVE